MKGRRTIVAILITMLVATAAWGSEQVLLQKVQGEVLVRPGVVESWTPARVGESLPPDATLKIGKQSTAVLVIHPASKRIILPSEVIVEVADIRDLSPEELMLKLTMQRVRASSYEWKNKEMHIPSTTTFRGEAKDRSEALTDADPEEGRLHINGVRVLFTNGFYSTSALRAMDVLRRYPMLATFDNRLLVAEALEKAALKSEALNEYTTLLQSGELTPAQREDLASRIAQLKKK